VNAFLSKKSMALRLASLQAKNEGWLAEHMAVIEVEYPVAEGSSDIEVAYIAAAFPAGSGKTSLAMMEVPPEYAKKGYKVRCISEDVAWLKKGRDGRLWAINPEAGVFGALTGLNAESNPNVIATASKNSIFTNTAHNLEDNTVWWEGMNDEEIVNAIDWRGSPWDNIRVEMPEESEILENEDDEEYEDNAGGDAHIIPNDEDFDDEALDEDELNGDDEDDALEDVGEQPSAAARVPQIVKRGAHSGSRFTAPISGCPNLSLQFNSPDGVPITAIVFGGRRTKTVPLVYQAFDWVHGVFVGTVLGAEPPNAAKPGSAAVRRDPMAMLRYCGYNSADYWRHWLKMGKKLGRNAPKIFNVNWFKYGTDGKPVWPGFGENIRVLDWIIRRGVNTAGGTKFGIIETPVGYIPKAEDINITGLESDEFTLETVKGLLYIDKALWKEDVNGVKQLYAKFGDKLPEELKEQLIDLEKRLMNA
jgi:phosphoenolpyruvate carboxykinase (GTP)